MSQDELIERYIYAVTTHLPQTMQKDVEKELDSIIGDMLQARCAHDTPELKDVEAVLLELGSPALLAGKYCGQKDQALISGIYYLWFKRLAIMLVPLFSAAFAIGSFVTELIRLSSVNQYGNFSESLFTAIFTAGIPGLLNGVIHGFFWLILIFFVLQHRSTAIDKQDFLDKLVPVPAKQMRIKLYEPILNIGLVLLFAIVFLTVPLLVGFPADNSGWIFAFNNDHIRAGWFLVLLVALAGITKEVFKLYKRRYCLPVAISTCLVNAVIVIGMGFLLLKPNIINSAFGTALRVVLQNQNQTMMTITNHINGILFTVILFGALLDSGLTLYRTLHDSHKSAKLIPTVQPTKTA